MSARRALTVDDDELFHLGLAHALEEAGFTVVAARSCAEARERTSLFLYLVIDRKRGNLGLARHQLTKIENELTV